MTDVVKIATERRVRLAAEIGKLNEFMQMAEALMKDGQLETVRTQDSENEKTVKSNGELESRLAAAAKNGAGGNDNTMVRELKVEEKMFGSLTKHNEPASDRQGIFRRAPT